VVNAVGLPVASLAQEGSDALACLAALGLHAPVAIETPASTLAGPAARDRPQDGSSSRVQAAWSVLDGVPDPEVPALSVCDLGIVRDVVVADAGTEVVLTPTYSGCPAMRTIEQEIEKMCDENSISVLPIKTVLSPAWTTDWILEKGRNNLREYGIAPPENEVDKSALFAKPTIIPCRKCGSKSTKMVSEFGSTACKAHYQCQDCMEPFDYFKCLK
jgi:ring-1,2-phenylacetyl-CoA epoxidase subunit PaaD